MRIENYFIIGFVYCRDAAYLRRSQRYNIKRKKQKGERKNIGNYIHVGTIFFVTTCFFQLNPLRIAFSILVPLFFCEKQGDSLAIAIKSNSKVALPLITKQLGGVRRSREGVKQYLCQQSYSSQNILFFRHKK